MIINQPDKLLDGMSDWCKEHHGKVSLFFWLETLKKWFQSTIYFTLELYLNHFALVIANKLPFHKLHIMGKLDWNFFFDFCQFTVRKHQVFKSVISILLRES